MNIRTSAREFALQHPAGFTLIEVLIAIVVIGITAGIIAKLQNSTWVSTRRTNNRLVAAQLITRQVETMRINIAMDSATYWPPVAGSLTDAASRLPMAWTVSTVNDPLGVSIARVRAVRYVVHWTSTRAESLVVPTMLSHDF
jgi:prepilin-type N-terminal cleavage/methylation domain-containing protein